MPVEIVQRRGGTQGRQRVYAADGYSSETAALTAVLSDITAELGGLGILDGFLLQGFDYDESPREDCYFVTASWGQCKPPEPPETGTSSFSFEVGLQPVRILVPPAGGTITTYKATGLPDLTLKLIGDTCNDDEPAQGVEISEPTFRFGETHYLPVATITSAYITALRQLVGRVNNATFKGFAAGEVLAQGISGSRRSIKDDWELSFQFAVRDNQTALTIGSVTVASKQGWQVLWPVMITKEVSGRRYRDVTYVGVADVYRTANFAGFGIGT